MTIETILLLLKLLTIETIFQLLTLLLLLLTIDAITLIEPRSPTIAITNDYWNDSPTIDTNETILLAIKTITMEKTKRTNNQKENVF